MINDKIDIDKSLEKGKLVTKTSWIEQIFDAVFYAALVLSFPLASGLFLFAQFKSGNNLFFVTLLLLSTLLFSGLLLYSVINFDKLKRIHVTTLYLNDELIREIIETLGWKVLQHDSKLTITHPSGSFFSSNRMRQVVILYDKQDILVNCTTYALYDFKSPFHWKGNKKIEKLLTEKIEQKIKQQTANNVHIAGRV